MGHLPNRLILKRFAHYSSSRLRKWIRKKSFFKCGFCQTVWFLKHFAEYTSSRLTKLIRKLAFSDGPSAKPFDFWSVSLSIAHLDWQNWLEKKLYIWKTRTCFSWVVGWGILGEMLQKVSERSLFYTFDFWIVSLSIAHEPCGAPKGGRSATFLSSRCFWIMIVWSN